MFYVIHIVMTIWRRKTTLLICFGLSLIIVYGLHYSTISERTGIKGFSQLVSGAKFSNNAPKSKENDLTIEVITRKSNMEQQIQMQVQHELGIPFVNLDPSHPYIPVQRIVHIDLKGAPPLVSFFKRFFPLIKSMGATGILLEYEDMFPFEGVLKDLSAKNAYTKEQVSEILQLAATSHLDLIPLIQTFGHMEFALKHLKWINLREAPESPQSICPSRNTSLDFIREIVHQVLALHPDIKYLHIGCDEVYQMGECDFCRQDLLHDNLFLRHIKNVAKIIHDQNPFLRIIIWDDMLRLLPEQTMMKYDIGNLVEPMIWVYAEDIYRFVQPTIWQKYSAIFKTAWTASAFKGAFGEQLYIPDARRHLENNLRWLEVMMQQTKFFKIGFQGLALTGWQRYDHFSVLCELLPAAIPSLALDLIAVSKGYFNVSLKDAVLNGLTCPMPKSDKISFIALESDQYLWVKLGNCIFPGSSFFRLTHKLHFVENEAQDFLRTVRKEKGWLTSYNARHNYSLPMRVDEVTPDLTRNYDAMVSLAKTAVEAMYDIFDGYTIAEWIEQRIYPYLVELDNVKNQSLALRSVNQWLSRPLDPLKDLKRFGINIQLP